MSANIALRGAVRKSIRKSRRDCTLRSYLSISGKLGVTLRTQARAQRRIRFAVFSVLYQSTQQYARHLRCRAGCCETYKRVYANHITLWTLVSSALTVSHS